MTERSSRKFIKNFPDSLNFFIKNSSRYQLRLPLKEPLKQSIHFQRLNVEQTLRRLLEQDLTFKGEKTRFSTHNLHAFAAKFPPQLPRFFINKLTNPREWVLDPMVGSGTTLVETITAGRNAIGIDLDPLSILIAFVKSNPLNLSRCIRVGYECIMNARKKMNLNIEKELVQVYSPQTIEFFRFWFEEHTIAEMFTLVRAIRLVKESHIRTFLKVVFSSIIITKTGGLTKACDLAHSRPHRDMRKQINQSAFNIFEERLMSSVESLENIFDASGFAVVARGDTRSLPLPSNSVHLIVTSPPYAANAIDYIRAHKFSLMWFGYTPISLTNLRKKYIGAELRSINLTLPSRTANLILHELQHKDYRRASVVSYYFQDMVRSLQEMLRVLAKGRAAVLVVGSSIIRGIDIKAPTVLAELAQSIGFNLVGVTKRQIVRDARMMPVSHNSTRNGIEARMHEEGVIGLIKPRSKR